MRAFIFISLSDAPSFAYQQPVLEWVKQAGALNLATLDIDAFSDEMLVNYACRLVQEAPHYAVYFKMERADAPLGASLKIIEEIIRDNKPGLVLLEGEHQRLKAIMQSRPHLNFKIAATETDLKPFILSFLQEESLR
jgi:hypothetical protein